MMKLLKTEWLKLKNYNAFIVLSSFLVLGVFTTNYIVYTVNKNIVGNVNTGGLVSSFNPYSFSMTWQTTSYATGWLLMLPALLLIILVTNEFTYKTNRQNIIDGWSREEFINVKLALALIIAVCMTILVFITALLFGFASGTDFSLNGFSHVGYFFLKSLSYNLIAVLMGVWIRRTGFAIGLYFIYLGAENIISQLLDVWSIKLRSEHGIDLGSMGDYLPMNASDGLLTFPDNPLKSIAKSNLPTDYIWLVIVLAAGYLVLFYWLSRRKIIKSDL
ncbi:MAG: ABC transporter permease [Bacteroidetes bacterium]|nr:ABC transporter permease [Bacteroidota bacterium]